MSRERGREMEREREEGKGGGKRARITDQYLEQATIVRMEWPVRSPEREGGRQGNVYNSCSFCQMVSEKEEGGRLRSEETNSAMVTVKIHIKSTE